jgi:hypothetical protein
MTNMTWLRMYSFVLAALALALSACDRNSGSGGPPPPGAKAGHLTGKLSDSQGKPLSNVTVSIFGFSDKGEAVSRELKVAGPAGEYDLELPNGKYNTPVARIAVDYNGRHYDLPLAAADGTKEWLEQKQASTGMVRDFVWKISGPIPGGDPQSAGGYWGGTIYFDTAPDLGDTATIELALKPDGPLIDGSPGQPLIFTKRIPWKKHEDHLLFDIPLGKYSVTAKSLYGTRPKPLRLVTYTVNPVNPEASPDRTVTKATVEFEFQQTKPGEYKLLVPNLVAFAAD